ncbi:MAG: class I SAM-dependent methyltransferase [Candidatus Woesearchaeota archaeon]
MKINEWDELAQNYESEFYTTQYILLPSVLKEFEGVENKLVLDLGCGFGYFSKIIKDKGAQVVGLDSSKEMINIAKDKDKNIKYICGEAQRLTEYTNKKFDYVLAVMFFCCIKTKIDFKKVFNEIKKVLKEDGKIIILDYHEKGYKNIDSYLLKHNFSKDFEQKQQSPQKFEVKLTNKKDETLKFFDYTWKLKDYKKELEDYKITIKELNPKKSLVKNNQDILKYFKENTVYMMLKAEKKDFYNNKE